MRTGLTFDPRTKLCVILFASFSLMVPLSFIYECLFMTILFILFLVIGEWKKVSDIIPCFGYWQGWTIGCIRKGIK